MTISANMKNKIALVTGGSRGIGKAISIALANSGACVYIADIDEAGGETAAEDIREGGGKSEFVLLDTSDENGWARCQKQLQTDIGRLDILVHNAGIEYVNPLELHELSAWRRVFAVNVEGLFVGTKALLPLLRHSGKGTGTGASVINISSVAGIVGFPNQAAYNTSKGAVRHLTKSLAIEFAESGFNIRVNSIHPGFIETPMLNEVFESWAEKGIQGDTPEQVKQFFIEQQPMRRLGNPEDIAAGALFLASESAGFITGSELIIDGGWIAR